MPQMDSGMWPEMRERLKTVFKRKTRDEWCAILEGTDACFAPVLSMEEAPKHDQNQARGTFTEVDGVIQPAPSPRFSRTKPQVRCRPPKPGEHTEKALADWGLAKDEIADLRQKKVVA